MQYTKEKTIEQHSHYEEWETGTRANARASGPAPAPRTRHVEEVDDRDALRRRERDPVPGVAARRLRVARAPLEVPVAVPGEERLVRLAFHADGLRLRGH